VPKPIAIVLNGASSSGKTSIARAIQRSSAKPVLHASLDVFTDMFDWPSVIGDAVRKECHEVGVANFHVALRILAAGPFPIVVDHVFERRSWFDECLGALNENHVCYVGIRCPVEVIEKRELDRGDRRIGMGRWQADRVHEGMRYDLELDTSILSPSQCAQKILGAVGLDLMADLQSADPTPLTSADQFNVKR
jgi:chloramphenicol 3-O phosphotransferase